MATIKVLETEPLADDIIVRLEEVLAKAREGKLSAVAIAVVYRDGSTGNAKSFLPSMPAMLGSLAILEDDIISEVRALR